MGRKKYMWKSSNVASLGLEHCEQAFLTFALLMVYHTSFSQFCNWLLTVTA